MLTIVIGLFIGWLFHFVGLAYLFHILLGFSLQDYYFLWFFLGLTSVVARHFRREK